MYKQLIRFLVVLMMSMMVVGVMAAVYPAASRSCLTAAYPAPYPVAARAATQCVFLPVIHTRTMVATPTPAPSPTPKPSPTPTPSPVPSPTAPPDPYPGP